MGRTNPTYRDKVRHLREEWEQYRRAIRYQHKERFDHLWDEAQLYSMAGNAMGGYDVQATIWMGMFLVQQREIEELRGRVEELER